MTVYSIDKVLSNVLISYSKQFLFLLRFLFRVYPTRPAFAPTLCRKKRKGREQKKKRGEERKEDGKERKREEKEKKMGKEERKEERG